MYVSHLSARVFYFPPILMSLSLVCISHLCYVSAKFIMRSRAVLQSEVIRVNVRMYRTVGTMFEGFRDL